MIWILEIFLGAIGIAVVLILAIVMVVSGVLVCCSVWAALVKYVDGPYYETNYYTRRDPIQAYPKRKSMHMTDNNVLLLHPKREPMTIPERIYCKNKHCLDKGKPIPFCDMPYIYMEMKELFSGKCVFEYTCAKCMTEAQRVHHFEVMTDYFVL